MILEQFYLACMAQASYVVADERTRACWVIDPRRDIEIYLAFAAERKLTITDVALTHLHADFVAGHLELRDRVGARVHLGEGAAVDFAFVAAANGDEYRFGDVRLVAWRTPGHTPEGVTWLVYDDTKDAARPAAALTGDTLFIGDVGRPDLAASAGIAADELAGMLHDSIARLLTLPDEVLVYPGHGAGSLCGRKLSKKTVSTIGDERRTNYALQPMPRAEFIRQVTIDQPPAPAYFAHDVTMNRSEHATDAGAPAALGIEALLARAAAGAQILDARDGTAFAAGHITGAINVGIDGQFAMWVGAVLDPRREVAIVADAGREAEVAMRLRRVGFDRIVGFLAGGMAALAARDDLVERLQRYEAPALRARLADAAPPLVIDVRNPAERATGAIPGSLALPLPALPARCAELPRERELVVHCAGGYRSLVAASILAARGFRVADLIGGYAAWARGGVG